MTSINQAAEDFLAQKRIAVTGVSRTPENHGSNVVYGRLKERGFEVFAVNPNTDTIDGDACYPTVSSIPGGVGAVVIGTRPERALATMRECAEVGVKHVWMHRAFGDGSVSPEAATWGREHGIEVIDGGCPLMFGVASDGGHRFMKVMLSMTGKVPRHV